MHHMWHLAAPALAAHSTIIAVDLRDYGRSSKPSAPSSAAHPYALYAKSTMAADIVAAMAAPGFETFAIAAHDRSAPAVC
jgi:haloacetate dehalogenase